MLLLQMFLTCLFHWYQKEKWDMETWAFCVLRHPWTAKSSHKRRILFLFQDPYMQGCGESMCLCVCEGWSLTSQIQEKGPLGVGQKRHPGVVVGGPCKWRLLEKHWVSSAGIWGAMGLGSPASAPDSLGDIRVNSALPGLGRKVWSWKETGSAFLHTSLVEVRENKFGLAGLTWLTNMIENWLLPPATSHSLACLQVPPSLLSCRLWQGWLQESWDHMFLCKRCWFMEPLHYGGFNEAGYCPQGEA